MRKITTIASLATAAALSLSACGKHEATTENTTDTTTITDETANGAVSTDGNLLDANSFDSQGIPVENAEDTALANGASFTNGTGNGL